uniref:EF-hand domain-containing protein n=1 Tax=Biomphalaria glabrata TaxID=6526 RepID=A0A2C9K8P8_BIOGL
MNGFGAEGGKTLGDALKVNRTLQKLDASYCRLPTECIGSIAHGLMHNDHLKIIDLSYNCFRAEETLELLKGIEKNEASQLSLLHLGNTQVEAKFKDLQDKLRKERRLEVIHGGILDDYRMEITEMDPMEIFRRDPFTKLKEWVAKAGYRLIDLLRHFDKDQSMTISTEEFRRGIAPKNEVFARHKLATCRQEQGQSIDAFLQKLRSLSKDCNFKAVTAEQHREESIRDAFITGIASNCRLFENAS